MNISLKALLLAIAMLALTPVAADAQARLDQITAATGTNTINSGNNNQTWEWNALTSGPGISFSSTSTASPGAGPGSQTLVNIELSGTNTNSNAVTAALNVENAHGGTTSTNYGIISTAATGTGQNIGVWGLNEGTNASDTGVLAQTISGSGATYGLQALDDSATGYAGYFNNTGGGYAAAFLGGNVGIGTATPANVLDIGTSGGIHIASGVPGSTSMALYNNSGTLTWNGIALATGSSVSGTTDYIPVFTGSNSLGNSVITQSSNNIGIAQTTPSYPLDIYNSSNSAPTYMLRLYSNTTNSGTGNDNALMGFAHQSSAHSRQWAMGTGSYSVFGAQDNFGIADQGTIPVFVIQAGGNIGVATTNPAYPLDVYNSNNSAPSYLLRLYSNTTNTGSGNDNALMNFAHVSSAHSRNWTAGTGSVTLFGSQDNFGISDNGSTSGTFVIQSGGDIGIGTTSPLVSLDLSQKTDALALPSGNLSQRPSGVNGYIRYNTSANAIEAFINGLWTSLATTGASTAINSSGRLLANGTTGLKYCPYKGNLKTTPSYGNYTIPSSCLTATLSTMYIGGTASQAAAASTLYYVFIINVSGTTYLDLETTGHATDSSTGIEVMSGNSNRTLVGMIHTDGSSHVSSGQNAQTNTVATWDNRIPTTTACSFSADRQITGATLVEINSENRCYFMSWGDSAYFASSQIAYEASGGVELIFTEITLDGTSTEPQFSNLISISNAGALGWVSVLPANTYAPAEGYHFTEMSGHTGTGGIITYFGGPVTTVGTIQ